MPAGFPYATDRPGHGHRGSVRAVPRVQLPPHGLRLRSLGRYLDARLPGPETLPAWPGPDRTDFRARARLRILRAAPAGSLRPDVEDRDPPIEAHADLPLRRGGQSEGLDERRFALLRLDDAPMDHGRGDRAPRPDARQDH